MSKILLLTVLLSTIVVPATGAATPEDEAAIRKTALDYIEGWYTGDAERMERALHPELAKRIVFTDEKTGRSRLDQMSAMRLVQYTRAAYGTRTPEDKRQLDVTLLDVFENAACVKIVATDWIDYLHVGKVDGEWKIINVLWESKPKKASEPDASDQEE